MQRDNCPETKGLARRAVTLIELIVVVVLLTVTAGLIVPRMGRSMESGQMREAVARFKHTVRTVRELAAAEGRELAVEIDLDRKAYAVVEPAEKDGQGELLRTSYLKPGRLAESMELLGCRGGDGTFWSSGVRQLRFYPDGTSSGASIRVRCDGCDYLLVIHTHSGRVAFEPAGDAEAVADQFDLGD
ncbi:MAG: hypothetical protein GXY33_22460 [Phycisphaerae bacterium]|nr:hypothetical protein [Phycisphaerae bacterium]